jgi:glycerophosphoryl diester phosphodiesterase
MTTAPAWLTARPIAHRGLHDCGAGPLIENSPSAARAAMALQCAIECDVQLSGDGEAVVFHDFTLERLTARQGRVDAFTAQHLCGLSLRGGADGIATLPAFLTLLGGATPLVCEIKSRFDGDMRLAERVAACAAAYQGPMCIESFDPQVMAHLRAHGAVNHTVITTHRHLHSLLDNHVTLRIHCGGCYRCTNGENCSLRRINDCRELIYTKHT